ncbi:MAG: GNAT family N-acetyltransferase [Termitinemataceae bacterium]|nr:MAG: GNAT family N-acetyltransferase [Termitinemataceae bacterium]
MELKKIEIGQTEKVIDIFKKAIKKMIANGIFQWDEIYPSEKDLTDDIKRGEMYGLVNGEEILAVIVYNQESDDEYVKGKWEYTGDNYAVLHRFCVNTDCQGRGIGTQMFSMIGSLLQSRGFKAIRFDAFPQNPVSLKIYEKLGYKKAGEINLRKGVFNLYEKLLQ